MAATYTSKHGIVAKSQAELYMAFADMRNFTMMLPADKKDMVTADYDTITVTVQNFNIGVRVSGRVPYSLIQMQDNGAPFNFGISMHFDQTADPYRTDFWIEVTADLNLMMKMMVGSKIQEGIDTIVDQLSRQV